MNNGGYHNPRMRSTLGGRRHFGESHLECRSVDNLPIGAESVRSSISKGLSTFNPELGKHAAA